MRRSILLAFGLVAACGDDGNPTPDLSVQITAPVQGELTSEDVTVQFSVGANIVSAVCTLDGAELPCTLDSLAHAFVDGEHTVTVQGFDGFGAAGEVASVTFTVDALPPVVETVTTTTTAPGTTKIDFTLSDRTEVLQIQCSVDGGAFTSCGGGFSGTLTVPELAPGVHTIAIWGVDGWGHSGQTAVAAPVPTPHATKDFAQANGPGHLILIGNDYADPVLPLGGPPPVTNVDKLLVNAVEQSAAAAFTRPLAIRMLDHASQPDELDRIHEILDPVGTITEVSLAQLEDAIPGSDVLLIPDQNGDGAIEDDLRDDLEAPLRAFLDAGGVVVVLDGTFESKGDVPSQTYRILAPSLLAIDDVEILDGACVDVFCNAEDPVRVDVPDRVCPDRGVVFDSPEPWVAYARDEPGETTDAFVLHRWFGAPPPTGPIAVSTLPPGTDVFFQDLTGASIAGCQALDNGTAVHHMEPGASISVGIVGAVTTQLFTIMGLQPLELVAPPMGTTISVTPGVVTVDLPGDFTGATTYRVTSGCGDLSSGTSGASFPLTVDDRCAVGASVYNVIGEALDANGELLAFTILNGLTPGGATVTMPAWTAPNLTTTIGLGTLSTVERVAMSMYLSVNGIDFQQAGTELTRNGAGAFPFYIGAGAGQPAFDQLVHRVIATFSAANGYASESERTERSGLISPLSLDLSTVLLPQLSALTATVGTNRGLTASWSASSTLTDLDGGMFVAQWEDSGGNDFAWRIVFAGGTSLTAPPLAVGGDAYWPTDGEDVVPSVDLFSWSDATPAQFRLSVGQLAAPRTQVHVRRTTRLFFVPP